MFGCALTAFSGVASAHPVIDEGVEAYNEADFDSALNAFVQAEARQDLTTTELLQLFEMRALVYHALGNEPRMRTDLQRLASVRPTYKLGRLAPPGVQVAFDDVREAIKEGVRLEVTAQPSQGQVRVAAEVLHDVTLVARAIEIHFNVENGEWQQSVGHDASVEASAGETVRYYAVLIGPGGAVVTQTGNRADPREVVMPDGSGRRRVPLASVLLWSGAGAALIGAASAGPIAKNKNGELAATCGATSPPSCSESRRNEVKRWARATDALWISGAALAVTGTIVYLAKRKKDKERDARRQKATAKTFEVTPWATRRQVGATARLEF